MLLTDSYLTMSAAFRWLPVILTFLVGASAVPERVSAQAMDVPVTTQLSLFLKVMTFDRNLEKRAGEKLVLAVAFQSDNRTSSRARTDVVAALSGITRVGTLDFEVIGIDLDRQDLGTELRDHKVAFLYVTPLRAMDLDELIHAARAAGVSTITGVPGYVEEGLSVGVRLQADRPRLMINLEASKLEGADYKAELLKLAQLIP